MFGNKMVPVTWDVTLGSDCLDVQCNHHLVQCGDELQGVLANNKRNQWIENW